MPVETTTGIPVQIESGNEYHFTVGYSSYPAGTWTAALVLSRPSGAPTSVAGTTSGTGFLFTLTSAVTAALAAGDWQATVYVTSSTQRTTAESQAVTVLPNAAATPTPSFAQAQVTLLQTVVAAFNATDKKVVDFQGQRFERFELESYQKQLTYWEARVIYEQKKLAMQRGNRNLNRIQIVFGPARPYYNPGCCE